ncbi:hypothetical protein WDW89_00435 [Deltaproteobacteria bacterium TL4]
MQEIIQSASSVVHLVMVVGVLIAPIRIIDTEAGQINAFIVGRQALVVVVAIVLQKIIKNS